jgi:phosphoglycolate phosphatase-like HAD superfamily hydrolase
MAALRAVLLDIDGTLVDSNDAHARAWVDALAEHGRTVKLGVVRRLIGMGGDKLLPRVSGLAEDGPEGRRISERRREIFLSRYLPAVRPFPAVPELVTRMRADGLRIAPATSAKREELEALLAIAGVPELADAAASSDDVDRSKPDPDVVGAALARAGHGASEAILIGDTPYDVEAATRAGVDTIALRCGGWSDAELAGALAIYDAPADLLAHYDDSPLARGVDGPPARARAGARRPG